MNYPAVVLAREAMATRFEVVLPGTNTSALRAAGEEALEEIERLEGQLSLYRPTSEIAHANARAAHKPVRLSPPVFKLLQHAQQLHQETAGAFDITIAPLIQCWGFMGGTGALPAPAALKAARRKVGMHLVELDAKDFTVRFKRPGVMLDLGAIGKGYALDRAVDILCEAGISNALIHGGASSIYALGRPPDAEAWKVAIEARPRGTTGAPIPLAVVPLREESLSVSAVWGKMFQSGDKIFGHIIDPRTGAPADNVWLAAIVLPSATEADALATALLIDGKTRQEHITRLRDKMKTLVVIVGEKAGAFCPITRGIELLPTARGKELPMTKRQAPGNHQ
jgi:thiamine biosynthesis lipoprotein